MAQPTQDVLAVISRLGSAVALIVALVPPVGYFVVVYNAIKGELDTEAQMRSGLVSQFIGTNPDMWRFDRHHLEEMLSRDPPLNPNQSNRLLDGDGKLIVAMGGSPEPPVTVRSAPIYDAGVPAGELEIVHSIRNIWWETAFAAVIGILLGGAVLVTFRVLPLRVLRHSLAALAEEMENHAAARRDAEAANRAKSRFLAAASHDLRQPMHALGLYAAVLEQKVNQPEVQGLVGKINASVEALESLFSELMDISRLDAGVLKSNVSEFPIARLFERLDAQFSPQAQTKGIALRIRRSGAWISSDPVLLERILINLVANAIRYTPQGRVLVGCRRRSGMLRIEVWDTGIGIADGELPRIFDEFYQVGNAERDRSQGLGLGLAIVRRVGSLLNHRIGVASSQGKGSCFSVEVPRVRHAPAPMTAHLTTADVRGDPGKMLLVIDDELAVRDSMAELMREWGYDVIAAGSLEEGLREISAANRRPDAVVADYRLGGGATGLDAIRRLEQEFGPGLPAAVITGDIAPERLVEFRESGYRHLHKPVLPVKLRELVRTLLAED